MRLIDADKLFKEIEPMYIAKKDKVADTFAEGCIQFEKLIKQQPTIDIVHCGQCIHYEEDVYISHHGDVSCLCGNLVVITRQTISADMGRER